MIKPADAQIVSGFTAASGSREINDGNKTLVNAIDLYVSPYGEYRVILNRHLLSTHALLIDPTMFRSCVLRPFTRTLLAKQQDGDRHAIVGEMSLETYVLLRFRNDYWPELSQALKARGVGLLSLPPLRLLHSYIKGDFHG